MSELYTSSRLRVFRQCARAHFYRYVLAIRTPSTHAMDFGTHTHAALEAWYRAWKAREDRLEAAIAAIDQLDVTDLDRVRLRVLVAAYDTRWGEADWEVIDVEVEFRYWLGDIQIGGKIDALIRERATGRVFVVEHKTSTADTSPGAPYWDRLAIDTQISIYIDGAAYGLDHEIAGCVYDVLKRPLHEPKLATPIEDRKYTQGKGCKICGGNLQGKQGSGVVSNHACAVCKGGGWRLDKDGNPESPQLYSKQRDTDETVEEFQTRLAEEIAERIEEFLARTEVFRLEDELPLRRQELIDQIEAMRALDEKHIAPPNHDACIRGRETCGYFAACTGRADIDDEFTFPRGAVHSELSAA